MTQTNEQLKEALKKLEEAISLYEEIVVNLSEASQEKQSLKSMKVLVNEKKHILDPSIQFDDIHADFASSVDIPAGHVVTTYYDRKPFKKMTSLKTTPVSVKPWLSREKNE